MTNAEKYVKNGERCDAFEKWCRRKKLMCISHFKSAALFTEWLESEFKEHEFDVAHCPFCGEDANVVHDTVEAGGGGWFVHCSNCGYHSEVCQDEEGAVLAHNRVTKSTDEREELLDLLCRIDLDALRISGDIGLSREIAEALKKRGLLDGCDEYDEKEQE